MRTRHHSIEFARKLFWGKFAGRSAVIRIRTAALEIHMRRLVVLEVVDLDIFSNHLIDAGKALNLACGRVRIERSALQTGNRQLQEKQP